MDLRARRALPEQDFGAPQPGQKSFFALLLGV
jgi:hypothetical protein